MKKIINTNFIIKITSKELDELRKKSLTRKIS